MRWYEKLRNFRDGVTIRAVARRAGVSVSTVWNLEQGRGTLDTLVQVLEDGLNRNAAPVFQEEGEELNPC